MFLFPRCCFFVVVFFSHGRKLQNVFHLFHFKFTYENVLHIWFYFYGSSSTWETCSKLVSHEQVKVKQQTIVFLLKCTLEMCKIHLYVYHALHWKQDFSHLLFVFTSKHISHGFYVNSNYGNFTFKTDSPPPFVCFCSKSTWKVCFA